jgi:type I restriction enzyme R subunit
MSPGDEDSYAEQPALAWLCGDENHEGLGWTYIHGSYLAPDRSGGERQDHSEVVLATRLRKALARLNPGVPSHALDDAVKDVMKPASPQVIEDHRTFHELLLSGVKVTFNDAGEEQTRLLRLVDFENPDANEFLAVNQFRIVIGKKNRRPDILLFVNGLPLGQVELKNPGDEAATAQAAVNQVAHYTQTIPALYRFVEIIGVSDLLQARVGTVSTPAEHFAEWKSLDEQERKSGKPQLQTMLEGVFAPRALLDLIRNFVTFESDGRRTYKVMAKYHQVHAVNAAVEQLIKAIAGGGRGGVVWHTQGSGKSYTMVFLVTKLRRDARFSNPTVVCVTDRLDLDDQLEQNFERQTHLRDVTQRADEVAGGGNSLQSLLAGRQAGGIIFTTIQKFRPSAKQAKMPVLSERRNIVVIADEAHRSQYASFAENITLALPNAARIGFTGTPIEKADRSSQLVFGDYISIYRMREAQEDGATVPIYYESRQVPVEADPDQLRQAAAVLEGEETEGANKLITAWAQLEKVVGQPERLIKVADDIAKHYSERIEVLEGKAMVVTYSRRIAVEMTALLRERLGKEAVDCIITASATDPPEISQYRRSKKEMEDLATEFKDPDSELRVVVVRDMWLTGFDAPALHTLYVDKPMRDHGLLQAIARVNRVFRDKPGGLVVDYIGIGEDLRASLLAYDSGAVDDPVVPLGRALIGLQEKYEVLAGMLHPAGFSDFASLDAVGRAKLLADAHDLILDSDKQTRELLDEQAALAKWYALVRTEPQAIALKEEVGFFNTLAGAVRKYTPPDGQASPQAEQAVRQFFSEGLAAGEVVDVFGLADKDRPELSVLSDDFLDNIGKRNDHANLRIRLLEKLLNDEIKGRLRTNRTQAKEFTDAIEELLARYEDRQLTSAEVVERLVELAKKLRDARDRHEQLGLTPEEAAFYDALAGSSADVQADPQLAAIAHDIVQTLRGSGKLRVDWTDHHSSQAAIRRLIKRLLRKHGYQPPAASTRKNGGGGGGDSPLDYTAHVLYEQARTLYRYWPDVDGGLLFDSH